MDNLLLALPGLLGHILFSMVASAVALGFAPRAAVPAWLVTGALVILTLTFNASLVVHQVLIPLGVEQGHDPRRLMLLSQVGSQLLHFAFLIIMLCAVFAGRRQPAPATGRGGLMLAHGVLSLGLMPWLALVVLPASIWSLATGRPVHQSDRTMTIIALVLSVLSLLLVVAATLAIIARAFSRGVLF